MTIHTVIKACKIKDRWDYHNNKPIEDNLPIGYITEVEGSIPESFIKWSPNKIFDRRRYPDLYNLFGKDHLPNDIELKLFREKHQDEWKMSKKDLTNSWFYIILTVIGTLVSGIFLLTLL
jgi:hypothetical protein